MKDRLAKYPILWAIVCIGLFLRLYAGFQQSLSNDELSAIYRLEFSHLYDLIQWGIKVDGHPALTQLFLYLWKPLAGHHDWVWRAPFILASTASLVYTFAALKKIIGDSGAYMVIAVMAFSGFYIQLGYFARPYAFGILFTSASFYYWTKIFYCQTPGWIYRIGFMVCSVLACYTHYFALLQIMVLGGVTFLVAPRKLYLQAVLMGLVIGALFAPHWPITAYQLSVGGIGGWLGKPSPYFFIDMLLEFGNRSWIFIGIWTLVWLVMVIFSQLVNAGKKMFWFICLGAIPYFILYIYSIRVNAVLQFSACYFLFPFLLAVPASFLSNQFKITEKLSIVILLTGLSLATLFEYKVSAPIHFAEFKNIAAYIEENESDSVTTIVAVNNPFYIDYYLHDKHPDLYITDMDDHLNFLMRYMDTCDTKELIYAHTNDRSNIEIPFLLNHRFPHTKKYKNFMNAGLYHFTDHVSYTQPDSLLTLFRYNGIKKIFEEVPVQPRKHILIADTIKPERTFAATFEIPLNNLPLQSHHRLVAVAQILPSDTCDIQLVMTVENGKDVFWRSRSSLTQVGASSDGNRTLILGEDFADPAIDLKRGTLKVYLWNPAGCYNVLKSMYIGIYSGNPYVTGYQQ